MRPRRLADIHFVMWPAVCVETVLHSPPLSNPMFDCLLRLMRNHRLGTRWISFETRGYAEEIRRRLGARVIGTDRHEPHPDAPIRAIAEKLIIAPSDLSAEIRLFTRGKGADVVFDLVGGIMFRSAVNSLALRGRHIEIAATGQREVSFDLPDFYHNESRVFGVDTLKRDPTASAEILDALSPGFISGEYRPAPIEETCALAEAQRAYRKVGTGTAGRVVLRPQE
jgi:NADPH:quinone reductase